MKKLGTCYCGELRIFLYPFFQKFGYDLIYVPKSISNYNELVKYSSDEWCFTLKLFYYDLLKAINMGANVIISLNQGFMFPKIGPCRLPHVAEHVWKKKLEKESGKKIKYEMFYFNHIFYKLSIKRILKNLGINLSSPINKIKFAKAFKIAKYKLKSYDEIITIMRKIRAREEKKGDTFKIFEKYVYDLEREFDIKKLRELHSNTLNNLKRVRITKKKPLRIGIVGDYVSIVAEFPCFDLENFISDKFGIEIYQPHTIYKYYFDRKKFVPEGFNNMKKKFASYWVGGSDFSTTRSIFKCINEKVDGIIQLRNFGCVPEQMMLEMVEQLKEEYKDFPPFLSICFDEHSTNEGIKTRVEAFCNTLLRINKKNKKARENKNE